MITNTKSFECKHVSQETLVVGTTLGLAGDIGQMRMNNPEAVPFTTFL